MWISKYSKISSKFRVTESVRVMQSQYLEFGGQVEKGKEEVD